MSGGSFNLLCYKDADEFIFESNIELIKQITTVLGEYDNIDEILKLTNLIFNNIDTLRTDLTTLGENLDKIRPVWRAIEWCVSGDVGKDNVIYNIDKFNREFELRNINMINLLKDLDIKDKTL